MITSNSQPSAYFPLKINKSQPTQQIVPLQFPSTRNILWESKPVGDFETLSLTLSTQDVQLFIVEKCLRLAHRYSEGRQATSFLLGSVYPKSDEGGICFGVDRFDPGREVTDKIGDNVSKYKVPTAVVPGDHVIPIKIKNELLPIADSISHTKDEFSRALQIITSKICGKDTLSLSHTMSLKANVYCSKEEHELMLNLNCGAIVPDIKFQALPIAPLPIIPTALARNLAGPLRLSDVQGTPKMGYITMDQTRKLLLLLESDPKIYGLPLIGIWISGVHSVHHPYVWASCLRYLNCAEIKDRVLHGNGRFLLLHYSVLQRMPNFWECCSQNNESLNFELLSCQEQLLIDLEEGCAKDPLCFHLSAATDGINKTLFDEANNEWKSERTSEATDQCVSTNPQESSNGTYDENPRPSPSPHPSPTQGKSSLPPVPEDLLSLSIDELSNKQHVGDNGNILAPRFNIPAKQQVKKIKNSEKFSEQPRPPLKSITSPNQDHGRTTFHERIKSNTPIRKQISKANKENTPITSRPGKHMKHPRKDKNTVEKTSEIIVNCHQRPREFENRNQIIKKSTPNAKVLKDIHCNDNNTRDQINRGDDNCTPHSQQNSNPKSPNHEPCCVHASHVGFIKNRNVADLSAKWSSNEDVLNESINSMDGASPSNSFIHKTMCTPNNPPAYLTTPQNAVEPLVSQKSPNNGVPDEQNLPVQINSRDINATSVSPRNSFIHKTMRTPNNPGPPAYITTPQNGVEILVSQESPFADNGVPDEQNVSVLQDEQRNNDDSENNQLLEDQVKKQEDMIRVLQEQVRSLLKMKEDISSPVQQPYLPLTPASTPENNTERFIKDRKHVENDSSLPVHTESTLEQCDVGELKPLLVTIGVNTGASLLWDNHQETMSTSVQCCIRSSKDEVTDQQLNNTKQSTEDVLTTDKTQSLVEVSEVDIKNDTNESLHLDVVDIPSFVDSSCTDRNSEKQKPSLDESNSRTSSQAAETSQFSPTDDVPSIKGKEYYDQLLCQVKDLLIDRIGDERVSIENETIKTVEHSSYVRLPTREGVVKATMRELEKIKNSDEKQESHSRPHELSSSSLHQRSLSTSFIPDHLRLNYVSMVADETFDELVHVDEIALKYLSEKEIQEYNLHCKTASSRSFARTVRFGSLPNNNERKSKDFNNFREVDFTWNNFSICTKNYLTKYNLVEGSVSMTAVEQITEHSVNHDPQLSTEDACKPPFPSPAPKMSKDKHEILDIKRLKKLPKLF